MRVCVASSGRFGCVSREMSWVKITCRLSVEFRYGWKEGEYCFTASRSEGDAHASVAFVDVREDGLDTFLLVRPQLDRGFRREYRRGRHR
jgi:hypothetical protein